MAYDFYLWLFSDRTMLSSSHVIVTSSQETSSPALPQSVVILPLGTTFHLNPQGNFSSVPIPSSPRPLQHVIPKPLASATFQRAPAPSSTCSSKGNSSLVSSSQPSIGSSISSVKFCFPDSKKPPLIQSELEKNISSPHVNSDQRHFQFTSSITKLSQASTQWDYTQPSSSSSYALEGPSSEPLHVSSTVSHDPTLSTRMILKKFLCRKRKRVNHPNHPPWRTQVTALVRRSIT